MAWFGSATAWLWRKGGESSAAATAGSGTWTGPVSAPRSEAASSTRRPSAAQRGRSRGRPSLGAAAARSGGARPSATGAGRGGQVFDLDDPGGDQAEKIDDPRPPAGGDVVVDTDDLPRPHRRHRLPAGAGGYRLERLPAAPGVGEDDQVRVGG